MKRALGIVIFGAAAGLASGEAPPPPARLLPDMGSLHHPISTSNAEAQKFFDQGMTLVYGFNHEEAIRSFEEAARLDPSAVMPLWGIAYSLGPNINMDVDAEKEKAAFAAERRALALAPKAPPVERAYVEALSKRYSDDPKADLKKLAADYAAAMKDLAGRYPDDLDARTLAAEAMMDLHPWQLWSPDGTPTPGTEELVSMLESVLRRDPQHVGANHYYIHATEQSPHPERALTSARRLETLVPGAGHLVHMPAHVYMRTGDYAAAADTNAKAAGVDRAYVAATGASGMYPLMYYNHNVGFEAVAAAMAGRYAEARRTADEISRNVAPAAKDLPFVEYVLPLPALVDLRFAKWSEARKAEPAAADFHLARAETFFARAIAAAMSGDLAGAERERKDFESEAAKVTADAPVGTLNDGRRLVAVMRPTIDARFLEKQGKTDDAIAAWRKAVEAEDALAYDEPPDWISPSREALGAALLRAGRAPEAEKEFRDDLEHNPRNPRSLFGLWKSLEAEKKDVDAAWIRRQYEEAWKNADSPLTLADL